MDNLTLWVLFMLVDLSMVLIAFKLFGRIGLYGMIVMSIIISQIQVLKIVEIFGYVATLGNILYGSIFFATDLLSEFYGKKDAKKAVWLGFFTMVLATLYMQIALIFKPSMEDFIQPHLMGIFGLVPRIVFASLIAYLISQYHDVWAFHFWKRFTKGKHLWLRNNASTLVSQLIDSVIFTLIAFVGMFEGDVLLQIFITTYLFKVIVAVIDTPFMYYAKFVLKKDDE
ncbi:MAG: queuosine precursor transporter [Nanoarchaeota archaeon]|nr:queuosine precursor transporter [Nanoarchaeota archaeon]